MKYCFLFSLVLFCLSGFCQGNFKPGCVVTHTRDTLHGFIDYRERTQNPVSVYFKKKLNDPLQVFHVANCSAYTIEDIESFQRFKVNISLSEVQLERLSTAVNLKQKTDEVFLKVLQVGRLVSLFYYNDEIKERFYILRAGTTEPVELIRHVFLSQNGRERTETKRYINQLQLLIRELALGDLINEESLLSLKYDESSLASLIAKINKDDLQYKEVTDGRFRLVVGGGLNLSNLTHRHGSTGLMAAPKVNVGVDVFLNPAIRKLLFRMELSIGSSRTQLNREGVGRLVFNQRIVDLMPQFIYHVYNANDLKFFLGMGGGLTVLKNKQKAEDSPGSRNTLGNQGGGVSFRGMLGAVFYKKVEIAGSFGTKMRLGGEDGYSNLGLRRFCIGAGYFFGK